MPALAYPGAFPHPNALAIEPYLRVKDSSGTSALAAAADIELGLTSGRSETDDPIVSLTPLVPGMVYRITASEAFAAQAILYRAAGGKVGDTPTGSIWGRAFEAAQGDGSQVLAQYLPGGFGAASSGVQTYGVSFVEDGSGTSYTATVEIPAGALVHDIGFTSTVLWNGTSASLVIGDDDDADGWFASTSLKATDLLVGEVLSAADDGTWGGKNGAYLTAAGRRGRVTSGVDSGWYYGAASEVIFKVTPGAADGSAGRSFGWVKYSTPSFVASTNV